MHRNILNTVRNPLLLKAKLSQSIFIALFLGGIYFGAAERDLTVTDQFNTVAGFMFFLAINQFMTSLSPISIAFPL